MSRKGYGAIAKKGARKGVDIDGMNGWVDMENQVGHVILLYPLFNVISLFSVNFLSLLFCLIPFVFYLCSLSLLNRAFMDMTDSSFKYDRRELNCSHIEYKLSLFYVIIHLNLLSSPFSLVSNRTSTTRKRKTMMTTRRRRTNRLVD